MKKNLILFTLAVLTVCLVSFAFDRIIPASRVSAASETHLVSSSTVPPEQEAAPQTQTRSAQPVVSIVVGIVCGLFGIIAVSPLLIGDPANLLEEIEPNKK